MGGHFRSVNVPGFESGSFPFSQLRDRIQQELPAPHSEGVIAVVDQDRQPVRRRMHHDRDPADVPPVADGEQRQQPAPMRSYGDWASPSRPRRHVLAKPCHVEVPSLRGELGERLVSACSHLTAFAHLPDGGLI
jgi:hypothetical protein